jgi:hypothetical protein
MLKVESWRAIVDLTLSYIIDGNLFNYISILFIYKAELFFLSCSRKERKTRIPVLFVGVVLIKELSPPLSE